MHTSTTSGGNRIGIQTREISTAAAGFQMQILRPRKPLCTAAIVTYSARMSAKDSPKPRGLN